MVDTNVEVVLDERTVAELWPVCEMERSIWDVALGVGVPEKHTCDRPSRWIVHSRCGCGAVEVSLLCTPDLASLKTPETHYRCPSCGWVGSSALTIAFVQELR